MGLQAAGAPDELHQLLLRVLAGEAQVDQALAVLAAAALRGKHDLVVPHTVHHFAADEQPRRSAAAQMQHDEPAFLQRLVHDLLGAANGHGPAVEGVAHHPAL